MAITNHERVGKAMELLRQGLAPFVEREVHAAVQGGSVRMDAIRRFAEDPLFASKPIAEWDAAGLLKLMWETWNDVFRKPLGFSERSLVSELRDWRNKWAHQEPFSSDDADRALDSMARLLTAVSAPQADDVGKMKMELRRLVFDEQVRGEKRKAGGSLIEAAAVRAARGTGSLQAARRDGAGLRGPLSRPERRVSPRVPRRRLREAHPGRLPDSPRDLRPALRRLVHAGEVPAHPRRQRLRPVLAPSRLVPAQAPVRRLHRCRRNADYDGSTARRSSIPLASGVTPAASPTR